MEKSAREELLTKSQSLGLSKEVAAGASPIEAKIILMLQQQNINQHETNRIIFGKLDAATVTANNAATEAKAGRSEVQQIVVRLDHLNSKTSKTIERVASIEAKEQLQLKAELEKKIYEEGLREGKWIIPKEKRILIMEAGKIIVRVMAFIGICATAYPVFKPLINYWFHSNLP